MLFLEKLRFVNVSLEMLPCVIIVMLIYFYWPGDNMVKTSFSNEILILILVFSIKNPVKTSSWSILPLFQIIVLDQIRNKRDLDI